MPNVHSKESIHMFKSTGVLTGLPKKHVCLRRLHQQAWVYTIGGNLKKPTTQFDTISISKGPRTNITTAIQSSRKRGMNTQ